MHIGNYKCVCNFRYNIINQFCKVDSAYRIVMSCDEFVGPAKRKNVHHLNVMDLTHWKTTSSSLWPNPVYLIGVATWRHEEAVASSCFLIYWNFD